jgi:hypothetical protein
MHVEVPAESKLTAVHEIIDKIERRLNEQFSCRALIHIDPVSVGDEKFEEIKQKFSEHLTEFSFTVHDFQVAKCVTHTEITFDVEVPFSCERTDDEIKSDINRFSENISADDGENYVCVVEVDRF